MDTSGAPRHCPWRCALLVLVCAAVAVPVDAEYRTVEVESLRITFDSDWAMRAAPGYLPVRLEITNLGEPRVIDILGQGSRSYRAPRSTQGGGIVVRQTLRLARGDRVRLTVPVPIFGDQENIRFEIREDDRTLERFNYVSLQSRSLPRDASVLIVADPSSAFGKVASTWPRATPGGPASGRTMVLVPSPSTPSGVVVAGGRARPALDFVLDPERLRTTWLGFTSLRAVVVGPTEWEQLNDRQREALLTWTACGGDLLFVDGDSSLLLPGQGLAAGHPDRPVRHYFFGRIHVPTSASVEATGLTGVLAAADTVRDVNWGLPANGALDWGIIAGRGFRLMIPGIDGVPARTYVSILILFSLLIGPANYWWLRRRRQQVLVVLTAPFISAVFIVLLAGYALAGEGLGVHGRAVTFTMLDQVRRQASTRATVSLYAAGMAPSAGLRFGRDVAVFPVGPDGTGSRGRLTLDLNDGQRFPAGVLQARSPTNLEAIEFRPARERLSFSDGPDGMSVVNGLDAPVRALIYRRGDQAYSLAGPLAPGGRDVLKVGGPDARLVMPADLGRPSKFVPLIENQPPGSYLAVLERSPFWDPGVSGLAERGSLHLVLGWPEGQP